MSPIGQVTAVVVPLGLVAGIYWPLWPELVHAWDTDPNYSHGYIVPLVSLLFVVLAWQHAGSPVRSQVARRDTLAGLGEIVFGLGLHLVMWFARSFFLDVLSLICILRGLLRVWGGEDVNRAYGFSVLFLMFMAPLPYAIYQPFAIHMQQVVSIVSTEMLEIMGVPVYREGYYIRMPDYTMEVAEACSGLRQLVAILALGVAIGHLSGRSGWYRWTLGLLSIPIAVAANCVRVVLSGLILVAFGRPWAEGVFHTIEGLAIVGLAALLLVGVAWGLSAIDDRWSGRLSRSKSA